MYSLLMYYAYFYPVWWMDHLIHLLIKSMACKLFLAVAYIEINHVLNIMTTQNSYNCGKHFNIQVLKTR